MLSLLVVSLLSVARATAESTAFSYFESGSIFYNGYFDRATCSVDGIRAVNATAPAAGEWMPWSHSSLCRIAPAGENSKGVKQPEKNYCLYSSTSFGGRRGISIITTPDRAATLAQRPAFSSNPRRVSKPTYDPENPPFQAGEIPGKGIGVVATRHIQQGEVILANTPALLVEHDAIDAFADEFPELFLVPAVANLPKDHREAYVNLSWHREANDYPSRINQIMNTNSFDINIHDEEDGIFFAVFTEISRLNHDCRPNCDYFFDTETLTHTIHATRDISPGEELSITYINPLQSRERRMRRLKRTWGFPCSCKLCTREESLTRQSDERIQQILDLRDLLNAEEPAPGDVPTPDMAMLLLSLYKQERLHGYIYRGYYHVAVEYNGIGKTWKAIEYARLGLESGLIAAGPNDWRVKAMQRLLRDPTQHWSWAFRLKGENK